MARACPSCGRENAPETVACPHCGALRNRAFFDTPPGGTLGGIVIGVAGAAATIAVLLALGLNAFGLDVSRHDCAFDRHVSAGATIAIALASLGVLIVGVAFARARRRFLGALCLTYGALVLAPASSCGISAVEIFRTCAA